MSEQDHPNPGHQRYFNKDPYPVDSLGLKESWRMFSIMSEFVRAFTIMSDVGPCVSVFGSARSDPSSPEYQAAETTGRLLAQSGFWVIS